MGLLSSTSLQQYWSGSYLSANVLIAINLLGALFLGMCMGYERSYHGRAAGMRTYGLVCVSSTALTIFVGFSQFWYDGHSLGTPDPTRVVQGIVTGIGFLCAGVITRDGVSISGLTTAASIWAASAVGVLLGVGFYFSAVFMALLCTVSMSFLQKAEAKLPSRRTLALTLTFKPGYVPDERQFEEAVEHRGCKLLNDSLIITCDNHRTVWKFSVIVLDKHNAVTLPHLAKELRRFDGVECFTMGHTRT